MKTTNSRDPTLHWELFIRQRGSAAQGVPPGKEALTWVANTVTLIWGERDALLVDTFLGEAQTTELADWIEAKGRTLRTIYLTWSRIIGPVNRINPGSLWGSSLVAKSAT